jgi:hypothetical protein
MKIGKYKTQFARAAWNRLLGRQLPGVWVVPLEGWITGEEMISAIRNDPELGVQQIKKVLHGLLEKTADYDINHPADKHMIAAKVNSHAAILQAQIEEQK